MCLHYSFTSELQLLSARCKLYSSSPSSSVPGVMCTDPGAPMNGARSAPSFEIASAVTYSCNEGYTLVGAAVSRCLSGGNYATPKPTCKGESSRLLCFTR